MNKKITDALTALETAAQLHKDSVSYAQKATEQIQNAVKLIAESTKENNNPSVKFDNNGLVINGNTKVTEVKVMQPKHHLVTDDGLKLFATDDSYRKYIVDLAKEELNNLEDRRVSIEIEHKEDDIIERGHDPLLGNYTRIKFDDVFFVNKKNRMVTCLLKGHKSGFVYSKGVAQCAKSDVFNEHIGKLIAYLRAANEFVPELFTNVPNPEEIHNGDIIRHKNDNHGWEVDNIVTVDDKIRADYHYNTINYTDHLISKRGFAEFKIIDDSNRK
ncbi:hypothetical protein pW4_89 [Bacillus phage pW4]|uniref:Uncharacterized protein n=1 Tax=Bacillus phage pW4 TaxID=2500560 RepID=A0A3T0II50_9CAUD|nr:hypothetical protein PP656_gp050 [Bacillus phage pW4]AZU99104.1 hypothetical protein pW4_89 [Bacillus phage pW4]